MTASRMVPGSDLERTLLFQIRAAKLPEPELQYQAVPGRRWRWDFAWPREGPSRFMYSREASGREPLYWRDAGLLMEVDGATWTGGRHVTGKGYEADCEKQSTAAALGWRTMRFTRGMVESGRALELIEEGL